MAIQNEEFDDSDLLTFRLPVNYLPGQDIVSKRVLNDQRIIDVIAKSLLCVPDGTYTTALNQLRNGTCCDVLYLPSVAQRKSLPPILIEVQRTVNEAFMRRLIMYSLSISSTYEDSPLPIALIFVVDKVVPKTLFAKFNPVPDMPQVMSFPCVSWAKECYLVSNRPCDSEDLPDDPLYALSLFFSEQRSGLYEHSHPSNSIIKLSYQIAKEGSSETRIYQDDHLSQVETICTINERILQEAKDEVDRVPETRRASRILSRGIQYNAKVKRRLVLEETDSDSSLDPPPPKTKHKPHHSSPSTTTTTLEDEIAFIKELKKNRVGRLSWANILQQGHARGMFKRYSTGDSLRTNFGKHV
ncbi:hypothetical protein O0I10_010527 [Lichtheimia ornata]|uniref:Uncharacterized protein n=1 Tax=Lichtheimia ornata TaxID=688661 RepID=A0AAD7UXB4_9FUNG|nr:uncharacterized protein O0I10_010527 [Lichtheimia ornata]KAJ8653846.1 hypothetical protein O0I10_010527 [Lichtheimia ornata]